MGFQKNRTNSPEKIMFIGFVKLCSNYYVKGFADKFLNGAFFFLQFFLSCRQIPTDNGCSHAIPESNYFFSEVVS